MTLDSLSIPAFVTSFAFACVTAYAVIFLYKDYRTKRDIAKRSDAVTCLKEHEKAVSKERAGLTLLVATSSLTTIVLIIVSFATNTPAARDTVGVILILATVTLLASGATLACVGGKYHFDTRTLVESIN